MLIKFFRNGKGAGAGPIGYLVADKVLAYDGNRDPIRDADGLPMTVTREPLPEVLRGSPERTEALIDASRHQWTHRACQRRSNFPQKCRSKIPHFGGFGCQPLM